MASPSLATAISSSWSERGAHSGFVSRCAWPLLLLFSRRPLLAPLRCGRWAGPIPARFRRRTPCLLHAKKRTAPKRWRLQRSTPLSFEGSGKGGARAVKLGVGRANASLTGLYARPPYHSWLEAIVRELRTHARRVEKPMVR